MIATFVNSLPSPLSNFKCKAAVLKVGTGSAFSLTSPYVIDQYLRMEMGGPSASTVPANQEGVVSQSFTIVNTMHGKVSYGVCVCVCALWLTLWIFGTCTEAREVAVEAVIRRRREASPGQRGLRRLYSVKANTAERILLHCSLAQ